MAKTSNSRKKNKTGIGLAIWLLAAIILIIVFLVKWETIHNNLVRSGIIEGTVTEKEETPKPAKQKEEKKSADKKSTDKKSQKDTPKTDEAITLKVQENKSENKQTENPKDKQPEPKVETQKIEKVTETQTTEKSVKTDEPKTEQKSEAKKTQPPAEKSTVQLCFITIDSDGSINYKTVSRTVPKNDSPLTNSINLLLQGPSYANSTEKNCSTLIPKGSKLLSASVKDGVAYLNFNEAFSFNPEGIEGYIAQLKQIILTATTFSTVKSVQFLIEGEKLDYLSDGVWIGSPLSRISL